MLLRARSAAVYGIDAHLIDVEVDFSQIKLDKEQFSTVGLPDAAVRESRDRVRSAIKNSGFEIPPTKITINLAPADLKKEVRGLTSHRHRNPWSLRRAHDPGVGRLPSRW